MKKWKILLLTVFVVMFCIGCEKSEEESPQQEETVQEEVEETKEIVQEETTLYTLYTEDKDVNVTVEISGEFEETDYSSETWLALEIPGETEDSSTQLMMYLTRESASETEEAMKQELNYLLSANTNEQEVVQEAQKVTAANLEWSCFTYQLDGLEGCKFWTTLENGCVLAGTIENMGQAPEPVNMDRFIKELVL